jgi:hypothetical protein
MLEFDGRNFKVELGEWSAAVLITSRQSHFPRGTQYTMQWSEPQEIKQTHSTFWEYSLLT